MKVLIDTNVLLDVILSRPPHNRISGRVLFLSQSKRFTGYVSAAAISDLYYILCKQIGHIKSLEAIIRVLTVCEVATVGRAAIESALVSPFQDFEDAVQNQTAEANGIDTIVTRIVKDFAQSGLQILMPSQLVEMLD